MPRYPKLDFKPPEVTFVASMTQATLQLRQLRSSQPSRSSKLAYAQMDRMQAAARKVSEQVPNGGHSTSGAAKKTFAPARK